jgi:hypothetical protein
MILGHPMIHCRVTESPYHCLRCWIVLEQWDAHFRLLSCSDTKEIDVTYRKNRFLRAVTLTVLSLEGNVRDHFVKQNLHPFL